MYRGETKSVIKNLNNKFHRRDGDNLRRRSNTYNCNVNKEQENEEWRTNIGTMAARTVRVRDKLIRKINQCRYFQLNGFLSVWHCVPAESLLLYASFVHAMSTYRVL